MSSKAASSARQDHTDWSKAWCKGDAERAAVVSPRRGRLGGGAFGAYLGWEPEQSSGAVGAVGACRTTCA